MVAKSNKQSSQKEPKSFRPALTPEGHFSYGFSWKTVKRRHRLCSSPGSLSEIRYWESPIGKNQAWKRDRVNEG